VDRQKIRKELGLSPDHYLISQIGILSWKGNDDTLDAMYLIAERAPQARLLFVGANAVKEKILRQNAATRGLAGRVSVLPYREDVPEILAGSDVCVDASYAGLGITGTLREALAVETAVIGTHLEGNPELIEDGKTGLLVPPHNPEALANALLRLIDHPDPMARAGRERVESSGRRHSIGDSLMRRASASPAGLRAHRERMADPHLHPSDRGHRRDRCYDDGPGSRSPVFAQGHQRSG
jgi:glycosyltransferase involved in cell wall biosynthesis